MAASDQRANLHRTIWRVANDLRGSVDGWDFKAYVLGMLFYRFISEHITNWVNKIQAEGGETDFNYAQIDDEQAETAREYMVNTLGFFIPPSKLFQNVRRAAPRDQNLNETLAAVFADIEASAIGSSSEDDLKGLFDDVNTNSPRLGNSIAERNAKLLKLLDAIADLELGNYQDADIDTFGDAYEYLMTMYASSAGKSGGEFFTPQDVSELIARLTVLGKTRVGRVYDPACGSGSLLLKFAKVLGRENVEEGFFGQEINLTTYNLCRINLFLHGVNFSKFDIALGDTLTQPAHWDDEPFEAIVSNPPYSTKWIGADSPTLMNDERFSPAGVLAPKGKADLAFTMHILSWLAVDGTAAIVQFPGVLYRGGAEKKIRKYLVDGNYVDAVIQLPVDLFFGTSIGTCVLVLKKSKKDSNVLFIDASELFERSGTKNQITEPFRDQILDAYGKRENQDHFAQLVSIEDIAEADYNLSVSSYVEPKDTREKIDIHQLNKDIAGIVERQAKLREAIDAIVADLEGASIDKRES